MVTTITIIVISVITKIKNSNSNNSEMDAFGKKYHVSMFVESVSECSMKF